jgi:hypothetical protein
LILSYSVTIIPGVCAPLITRGSYRTRQTILNYFRLRNSNKLHNEKTSQLTKDQRYNRLKWKRTFQTSWKEKIPWYETSGMLITMGSSIIEKITVSVKRKTDLKIFCYNHPGCVCSITGGSYRTKHTWSWIISDYSTQGLKNPLVRGPGPAICGFGPNISNPIKSDGPVETVQLRTWNK